MKTTSGHTTYLTAYKFNGKEMDAETGLYYYGARYYEPELAMWYGVDALAEKYASMGGYVYCAGNPVKLIDPDGNDWYETEDGELKYVDKYYKNKVDFDKNSGLKGEYLGHTVEKDGIYYGLLGIVKDGENQKELSIPMTDKGYAFCKAIDSCFEKYMLYDNADELRTDFAEAFKKIGNVSQMGLNFFGIGDIDANYGKNTKLSFSGWGQVNGLSFIPSIKELKRRGLKENEIKEFQGAQSVSHMGGRRGYVRSFQGSSPQSSKVLFLIYQKNKGYAESMVYNFESMYQSIHSSK